MKELQLGFRICQLARFIHQDMTQLLLPYGLTPEQWVVVQRVAEQAGLSQRQLSQRLKKDENTVKGMVDRLCKKNILARQVNPKDRRQFCLSLTEEGLVLHEKLQALDLAAQGHWQEELSDQEALELSNLLSRLEATFKK